MLASEGDISLLKIAVISDGVTANPLDGLALGPCSPSSRMFSMQSGGRDEALHKKAFASRAERSGRGASFRPGSLRGGDDVRLVTLDVGS
jgi:hypothetical protein